MHEFFSEGIASYYVLRDFEKDVIQYRVLGVPHLSPASGALWL